MQVIKTRLFGVLTIEPRIFADARGFLFESYNQKALMQAAGISDSFVQDNHSQSGKHVLRGLHYQIRQPQGKLVRAIAGRVLDVAVDLRRSSATFAQWLGVELSAENRRIAWIPKGFAHGFIALSEHAEVVYKTTDYWAPEHERTIAWNDPDLAIDWLTDTPTLSAKDHAGVLLRDAEVFE
jgi:dTDP-4-dehydrorhamnose 3,5-epimerase